MKALVLKDEQFVTNANGKTIGVILPLKSYERLREAAEQHAEIQAYDAAHSDVTADLKEGRFLTLEDYRNQRSKSK